MHLLAAFGLAGFKSRAVLQLENLALRHQLGVLHCSVKKPRLTLPDRLLWAWLCGTFIPGKPRVWVGKPLANVGLALNLDLAPDGKRFIVLMPAESTEARESKNHVMLITNFFDEVRRRVAASK